jgi:hypothetical protein
MMETFGVILMVIGGVSILIGISLAFTIAMVYALITYLEGKE